MRENGMKQVELWVPAVLCIAGMTSPLLVERLAGAPPPVDASLDGGVRRRFGHPETSFRTLSGAAAPLGRGLDLRAKEAQ